MDSASVALRSDEEKRRSMRWKPVELLEWAMREHSRAGFKLSLSSVPTVQELSEIPGGPYVPKITGSNFFGHLELRKTLGAMYGVEPDQILVAQGAAECDFLIAGVVLQQGGTAIVEAPTYQPIFRAVECFADRMIQLPRRIENRCLPDPDELRKLIDDTTKLIALTNLHNPTGVRMDAGLLREIAQLAGEHGAVVLVDEVFLPMAEWDYHKHASASNCITVGSMDKCYGLSNLRVGWAVGSSDVINQANSFNMLLGVHQPFVTEDLASQILGDKMARAWFCARTAEAQKGRRFYDRFIEEHPQSKYLVPDAGINGILALPAGGDDRKFIEALAARKDTVAFPGSLFGLPGTIRVSYGGDPVEIEEGFKRLGELYREW
ncbi:pyridoxal phosphate-dependent aminotransferase [bacterium]|nr:pyridoxal phosphate-dependent aminotransferase [bacterium]